MFSQTKITKSIGSYSDNIEKLKKVIDNVDFLVIGAGAGLSTAAGFTYSGERFDKYFFDFKEKYNILDMYSGGFYPFEDKETMWAWWSRHIYFNRYIKAPKDTYKKLLNIVKNKNYFVITTNVDHQFQISGFDKKRLFYTQGDYGLWQSVDPKIRKTYDNEKEVYKMLEAQGFIKNEFGEYDVPKDKRIKMKIPTELIPRCPDDNSDMTMNLRADNNFVEDEGWHKASLRYSNFIESIKNQKTLYLELGVGMNTPMIIKYPFWKMVSENKNSIYACINYNEAYCPEEISDRAIVINEDIDKILGDIIKL